MNKVSDSGRGRRVRSIILVVAILFVGVAGLLALKSMRKPPKVKVNDERTLTVETLVVQPDDYPVALIGYADARPRDVIQLAPEVSGRIAGVHPKLEPGDVVRAHEPLVVIDARDYTAAVRDAEAEVARRQAMIASLTRQSVVDTERLDTLQRSAVLATGEYDRLRRLLKEDQVGTQSGVDNAERGMNAAREQAAMLARAVSLYPVQLDEARAGLAGAQARLDRAKLNVERCTLSLPFAARIKTVSAEAGQFAPVGQPLMTVADDSLLELRVPLDTRDAKQWLRFEGEDPGVAWFTTLDPVACAVHWTEDTDGPGWTGRLDRAVQFAPETRTLVVAVQVPAAAATANRDSLPLVEGMFCRVTIPGAAMTGVVRLPSWAVSFEGEVFINHEGRLKTVPVVLVRVQGEYAYVRGLHAGDEVIVTRLASPLEDTKLNVVDTTGGATP